MKTATNKQVLAWAILLTLVLVWGSSFILMKRGLEVFSAYEVGGMRTSIAFLVLLPFALQRLRKVKRHQWKYLLFSGACGSAAPAFLFAKAQTGIDSSLAGILNSMTPLFTLLIGIAFFRFRTRWFNILGLFIGLAGAAGLTAVSGGKGFEFNFSYAIYVLIATACYATNINIIRYYLHELDSLSITIFSFFLLGVPLIIYTLGFTDFLPHLTGPGGGRGFLYIAILSVFATAAALVAFNQLIKISNIIFASSVTYLIPIVALLWGVGDGELFSPVFMLWIALILGGVFLVNFFPKDKPATRGASKV